MALSAADPPEPELGTLQPGDERRVSDLIRRMSGEGGRLRLRDKSPAYYRWMYEQNPSGRAIVHSARLGDDIVASFALAPKRFVIDGEHVLVGKTMDMFTDPSWQGHGLMGRCTSAVFRGAAEAGIAGWYVTPSVNSYPIFTDRWGYPEPFSLIYRLRPVPPRPVRRPPRLAPGYAVEDADTFDGSVTELWQKVAPAYTVAQVRDAAYLNWRYVANPDSYDIQVVRREGELVGVVVLGWTVRRGIRVGELMELIHPPDEGDILRLLVRAAAVRAGERGCRLLQAWSVPGTPLDDRLRRAGLRWRRGDVKFLLSPGFPGSSSADPRSWLLSQGDGNDV